MPLGPAMPALAQAPPGAAESLPQFNRPEFRLPDTPEADGPIFELPEIRAPERRTPPGTGPLIPVDAIRVTGHTVFSDERITAVVRPYLGRALSITEIEEIREALTRLYIAEGYINSGAFLPDQRLDDGVIEYQIVEGTVTEIAVSEHYRLRDGFIRARLEPSLGPPLDIDTLRDGLTLLTRDQDVETVRAALEPGIAPGQSRLRIDVEPPPLVVMTATFDNVRSPAVGALGSNGSFGVRNVSGWGESVTFFIDKSEGLESRRVEAITPVSARGTKLRIAYESSLADVLEEPGRTGEIESEFEGIEAEITQSLYHSPRLFVGVGMTFERLFSQTFLLGEPFAFVDGVDTETGINRTAMLRPFGEIRYSDNRFAGAARARLSFGLPVMGATVNDAGPSANRTIGLLQLRGLARLPWLGLRLVGRIDAQQGDGRLLPLEQFVAGGMDTVRGYREAAVIRDNGVIASLEARLPLPSLGIPGVSTRDGALELAAFYDYAHLWSASRSAGDTNETDQLGSVGLGFRWTPLRGILAETYYAHALHRPPFPTNDDLQDRGFHFRVSIDAADLLRQAWDSLPRTGFSDEPNPANP